jgi:hypothetical protein
MEQVRAKWRSFFATATFRGSKEPVFARVFANHVWGPAVQLDPNDPTPMPEQLKRKTLEAIERRDLERELN